MATDAAVNPYVGPRPFEPDDARLFFGRSREVRDVVSLVIAQRIVLVYSASGAGKSSLLNAGVLPRLSDAKGFDVLPAGRVRADETPASGNVFVRALATSLGHPEASLADVLADRQQDSKQLFALVIDQFEELFTAHPERWRDQTGLFDELRTALEQIPRVRMILAIREDFLAQLDPFTALLPGGLRTRFRLERLDRDSALAAVLGPLEGTERSYAPGVADTLVTDLLKFRVDGSPDPVEGQFVEPVQLQVTCRTLWSDLPADVREITSDHLRRHADVDEVLGRFYDDAVRAAARDGRTRERRIRDWVKRALITPGGTRAAAYAGPEETAGLSNRAVQVLDEQRLIRAEWRAGARWYELTHDRLIEPIRRTDERRRRRRRTRVLIASGAAIAVAGVAAGLLFAVSPAESPTSFEPSVSVVVSAVQVTPTRDGMRVAFRVQSRGLGGSALRALVVAERSAGGHIVGTRARVIRAPDSVEVVAFSLPTRRAYVARVGIARASDSALLATASSLPVRAPLPIPTPQPTEVPTATATPG